MSPFLSIERILMSTYMQSFNLFALLLLDPHFVAWGQNAKVLTDYDPSLIHTFYGSCDTIAFETSQLQLQVRTRPGGGWSGVVQVGLKWLPTGETIFLFDGSARLVTNNVDKPQYSAILNYESRPKESSSSYAGDQIHYFYFLGGPDDKENYMKIEEWKYGLYNIEIKGHGSTFAGSKGSLGAWSRYDENYKFILRDNTVYFGTSIFDVIYSWRVLDNGESILNDPSTICTSSSECYPTYSNATLPCVYNNVYRDRKVRGLQTSCDKTCDDLTTPLEKKMCQLDVALSGETDWACQATYTDPIIYESECSSSCKGDATTEKFPIADLGVGKRKKCEWAVRRPGHEKRRCSRPEVALNCCATCCSECVGDAAGTETFQIPELFNIEGSCMWAGMEDSETRCAIDTVARKCCDTCSAYF